MKNIKYTRTYAQKLALKSGNVVDGASQLAYIEGYMKSITETNAPEMLKALQRINTQLDNWKDNGSVDMIGIQSMMKISEHAIQKAKD